MAAKARVLVAISASSIRIEPGPNGELADSGIDRFDFHRHFGIDAVDHGAIRGARVAWGTDHEEHAAATPSRTREAATSFGLAAAQIS